MKAYSSKKSLSVLSFFLIGFPLLCVTLALNHSNVSAADPKLFNPERIINDDIFTNNNSMSAAQIQDFLNKKNSVCLKNFSTLSLTDDNNDGQVNETTSEPYGKHGQMSAAQVIKSAADIYKINPQVILVTLEKEQGLITRQDCPSWRYNTALGYGCPDTAPCSEAAYGFTRQIDFGVFHFRGFFDDSLNTVPYGVGNHRVYYNPGPFNNSANNYYGRFGNRPDIEYCGSTILNIQNRATAALYSYTPYQPNAASLNAGYGSAAPCGAYGNRNFFLYFSDWFGSPVGPMYKAEFLDQSSHITLVPGKTEYVWFKVKNTGASAWGDDISSPNHNPIHLATDGPINRSSIFSYDWPMNNRPNLLFNRVYEADGTTVAANQHVVEPGQVVEFKTPFTVQESVKPGTYKEDFALIREGAADWWLGPNLWVNVTVLPTHKATYISQSTYPLILRENEAKKLFFQYRNTGNEKWYDDISAPPNTKPVHLATSNPINTPSPLGASWTNGARPAVNFSAVYESNGTTLASNQHIVEPGQIGRFEFDISAMIGSTPIGEHILAVQPIHEGATNWDMGGGAWTKVIVNKSQPQATYYSQSDWPTVNKGEELSVYFSYKNTGGSTWRGDKFNVRGVMPIHLATTGPINRTSPLGSTWINGNRPAVNFLEVYEPDGMTLSNNQYAVEPGQIGRFEVKIKVPQNISSGEYIERFQPIAEGAPAQQWQMGGEVFVKITVR